jgi:riboflavin kinase/FMN adenylyltransferase
LLPASVEATLVAETLKGRAPAGFACLMTDATPKKPFVVQRDGAPGDALRGAVLAIGNFDGVHRGHRAVIAAALGRARRIGRPAAALTFEPHPAAVLRPQEPMFRLTNETAKLRLLAATGLDGAIVLTFNAALASLTPEEFVRRMLVERYRIAGAAIGFDFHFGKNRMGSPAFLQGEGARHGFAVDVLPPLQDEGRPVSSGTIRTALAAGRVIEAAELLGYPWFVSGTVIPGEKRGRDLGYPTANMRLDPGCGLKHGIYAVRVGLGGKLHDAVASFGRRPMFDNGAPLLEVFLFDFDGDLYGQALDVAFIAWIRHEMRFDSVDDLVRQMGEDSARAKEALGRAPGAFPALGDI